MSMFDPRKSPETNHSFIYGFVYIHINAFGIDANIGVCWKSSMIGFRSFFNRRSRSSLFESIESKQQSSEFQTCKCVTVKVCGFLSGGSCHSVNTCYLLVVVSSMDSK